MNNLLSMYLQATRYNGKPLAACWTDKGKVLIFDLSRSLQAVDDPSVMSIYVRNGESAPPLYTFAGHQTEGYALDWAETTPGKNI